MREECCLWRVWRTNTGENGEIYDWKGTRDFFLKHWKEQQRERILEVWSCFAVEARAIIGIFIRWL